MAAHATVIEGIELRRAGIDDHRFHFPTDGSGALVDRNAYSYGDALTLRLDAGRRWSDAFETRFTFDVHETDRGSDDSPDGRPTPSGSSATPT